MSIEPPTEPHEPIKGINLEANEGMDTKDLVDPQEPT
jgi:hypothetical protein